MKLEQGLDRAVRISCFLAATTFLSATSAQAGDSVSLRRRCMVGENNVNQPVLIVNNLFGVVLTPGQEYTIDMDFLLRKAADFDDRSIAARLNGITMEQPYRFVAQYCPQDV